MAILAVDVFLESSCFEVCQLFFTSKSVKIRKKFKKKGGLYGRNYLP